MTIQIELTQNRYVESIPGVNVSEPIKPMSLCTRQEW